jgi:nucleotide-binding universal stress UspA family protein
MQNAPCRVLVVVGGLGLLIHAERAAELACHFCEGRDATLIFVYPIVVPLALPLDAPLPAQERDARDAIERAMSIASRRGCKAQARIVRHRRAADAVLELSRAEQVEKIVLGVRFNWNVPHEYDNAETVEEEILRRAQCEVIVDREPMTA